MMEAWREFLYPLGFIAQIAFGLRFLQQWWVSERLGRSIATKQFWVFSIIGNILLGVHSVIQSQVHVCLSQAANTVIAWRNLNLMQKPSQQYSFRSVCLLILMALVVVWAIFFTQNTNWFRIPIWFNNKENDIDCVWHWIGSIGLLLFTGRFWVQWLEAEKESKSVLQAPFWWLSILGALFSFAYFWRIGDLVNLLGPALGMLPYIRNLLLIRSEKQMI